MKNINKNFLKGVLLNCVLLMSNNQQTLAAETGQPHIYPITNQMVDAVKKAPNAAAALDALCGQGGVIRGSGLNAGNTCKLQDFARVAVMACKGYVRGKDTFESSKCSFNINKVLGSQGRDSAPIYIKDSVEKKYSNITTFVCDTTPGYRDKLPAGLKAIAVNFCPKPIAPGRPTAKLPGQPSTSITTRPRANAISNVTPSTPIAQAIVKKAPPIVFSPVVTGALRNLPPRDSLNIDYLLDGQKYLLDALEGLEKKDQQQEVKGVSKINPISGNLARQENALINNYENTQTTLLQIKTAIEVKKPIAPELYKQAQELTAAIKNLTNELDKASSERLRNGG